MRLPFSDEPRLPAVIFMHGDAGALPNQVGWIDEFNAIGVAVFTIDSFSGRGALARTAGIAVQGAGAIGSAGRVADAYRALAVLAGHPRIDPSRIVLMGVSSGGRVAIHSAMARFARVHSRSQPGFAGFIALYPTCNLVLREDTALLPAPLRIHHGAADMITRSAACDRFVQRLRAAGNDAEFHEYADAEHGFDSPPGWRPVSNPQTPNPSGCTFEERDGGQLVNADTGKPVTLNDRCVEFGLRGGRNDAAASATLASVKAFVRSLFKLP